MRLRMLGSGSSAGVPRIGGNWGRANPADPRNNRRRASVLVEHSGTRLLVDTGPDLRAQLLQAQVSSVTAVLYTHAHADHCHGIDDLRGLFHLQGEIDCYMDEFTLAGLRTRFPYIFSGNAGYPPIARPHLLRGDLWLGAIHVRPFWQVHGPIQSVGFRFEAGARVVVYSTDVSELPADSWELVTGADLWVVDALRRQPHPTHSHLARTLEWIARAGPREAWLTHMDESMDVSELLAELPPSVSPGWDGRVWDGGA